MSELGLKMMGKDEDGKALGVSVEKDGTLKTTDNQMLESLDSVLINNGDYWSGAANIFDKSLIQQGSLVSLGQTDSNNRTHVYRMKVKPGTEYILALPKSKKVRIRGIFAYADGQVDPIFVHASDVVTKVSEFKTRDDQTHVGVSFCKSDITESLSVRETISEDIYLIELNELRQGANLFNKLKLQQGGIQYSGEFSTSLNRTHSGFVEVEPNKLYKIVTDNTSEIRIRNIVLYSNGRRIHWATAPNFNLISAEEFFVTPENTTEIAVAFCKTDPDIDLTVVETGSAEIEIREVY